MNTDPISGTALVTGGSKGIGKAISEKLIAEGCKVIIADIIPPEGALKEAIYMECDVSDGVQVDRMFSRIMKQHGLPDFLILNAGRGIREKLTEGDPEKWQQIIHTNVMGPLRCIRSFVPPMTDRGKGSVVFISSVAANQPHPYGGIYAASKSALEVIAETLRQETLPHLKITIISPGIVDTDFFKDEVSGNLNIDQLGMGAINAAEIAEDVWYALNKNTGTAINKIITRPINQNF